MKITQREALSKDEYIFTGRQNRATISDIVHGEHIQRESLSPVLDTVCIFKCSQEMRSYFIFKIHAKYFFLLDPTNIYTRTIILRQLRNIITALPYKHK